MGSYSLRKDCDIWWKQFHRGYGALFLCFFSACMFAWSSLCFVCVSPLMEWKQSHASDSFICLPPQTHSHTYIVSLSKAVNVIWTRLLRSFILHLHFYPLRTVCVFAHEVSDNLFFCFAIDVVLSLSHILGLFLSFFPSYFIIICW